MGTNLARSGEFFVRALAISVALLWGLGSAAGQPTSELDRCKSDDVRGTTVSLDDAVAACSTLIEGKRASAKALAEIRAWRGDALLRKNDLDRAAADFGEAIRTDPTYVRAYYGRGLVRAR